MDMAARRAPRRKGRARDGVSERASGAAGGHPRPRRPSSRVGKAPSGGGTRPTSATRRRVFVVHGRNHAAREGIFAYLRALGLEPIEWDEAVRWTGQGSPYVKDVVEAGFSECQAALVLLTGDDEARLRANLAAAGEPEYESRLTPQARPNVLFEAGLALGLRPERTILARLGDVRPWSDVHGMHFVQLDVNAPEWRQSLRERLRGAGCRVKQEGSDWLSAGQDAFAAAAKLTEVPPVTSVQAPTVLEQVARVYDALKGTQVPFKVSQAEWTTIVHSDFTFEVIRRETWHALDQPLVFRTFDLRSDDTPVDGIASIAFETRALDGDARLVALPAEDGRNSKRFVGVLLPPISPHASRRVEWRYRWPGGASKLAEVGQWDKYGCALSKRAAESLDSLELRLELPRQAGALYEIEERTLAPGERALDGATPTSAPERVLVETTYRAKFRELRPGAEVVIGVCRRRR